MNLNVTVSNNNKKHKQDLPTTVYTYMPQNEKCVCTFQVQILRLITAESGSATYHEATECVTGFTVSQNSCRKQVYILCSEKNTHSHFLPYLHE